MITTPPSGPIRTNRERLAQIFCSPVEHEVFSSVSAAHDLWSRDPYDVDCIHAEARDGFNTLVERANANLKQTAGRVLLLRGEAGSGKTHLLRAFRSAVHNSFTGMFGYLQMTSDSTNYARYVLTNLIDSLQKKFFHPAQQLSALVMLAERLGNCAPNGAKRVAQLRESEWEPAEVAKDVLDFADAIIGQEHFAGTEIDLVRALLYLIPGDNRFDLRVLKYLRCEDLSRQDRDLLGLVPRLDEADPHRMVVEIGKLLGLTDGLPLILAVDQVENEFRKADGVARVQKAFSELTTIASDLPGAIVVVACLDDMYTAIRTKLQGSTLDRIENNPPAIILKASRSAAEAREMLAVRLRVLYGTQGADADEADPTYPIPGKALEDLAANGPRRILEACHAHRQRCIQAGSLVPFVPPNVTEVRPVDAVTDLDALEQLWNDYANQFGCEVPGEETALAEILATALVHCGTELNLRVAAVRNDRTISVTGSAGNLLAGICLKSPNGSGLINQINEICRKANKQTVAIVRCTPFPGKGKCAELLGELIKAGGRRVVFNDSDWRALLAFEAFRQKHGQARAFEAWRIDRRPLTRRPPLQEILALENGNPKRSSPEPEPPAPESKETKKGSKRIDMPVVPTTPQPSDALLIGTSIGVRQQPVCLSMQDLAGHAVFLGGTGSGKTTVALNLIEQLQLQGVPAILIDRKGDLAAYADPERWRAPLTQPEMVRRRDELQQRTRVQLYTPGRPDGNPLCINLIPNAFDKLTAHEQEQTAGQTADALVSLLLSMRTINRSLAPTAQAVFRHAMLLLSRANVQVSLPTMMETVGAQDSELVNAIGIVRDGDYGRLAIALNQLRHRCGSLLASTGTGIDIEKLLGVGKHAQAGRTALTVISTKFLSEDDGQFWISQFLMELRRWVGRHPSPKLQAVLMLDEADIYLPAVGKPATKQPVEDLLRRARSMGLGLFLATQSPGDLDYRCRENIRSWLLGRVQQPTALEKLKPLLAEYNLGPNVLAGQSTGEFHLAKDGQVTALKTHRNLLPTDQVPDVRILELAAAQASKG